jgi:hypothetical protein
MEAALGALLGLLILAFVAIAVVAVYIFVTVLNRQRRFRKDFDRRWNNRF